MKGILPRNAVSYIRSSMIFGMRKGFVGTCVSGSPASQPSARVLHAQAEAVRLI